MDKAKELFLAAGVIFLVMFPYIWKGQDVQVNVWDNLDSNVVWYKMLKDQGKIFAGPEVMVQGFVTETPRFSYPSGSNVEAFLYFLFPTFTAYWVNKLLIIICAFGGMLLLFSHYLERKRCEVIFISILWANEIITETITEKVTFHFDYLDMNEVMRIIKAMDLQIKEQHFDNRCSMTLEVRQALLEETVDQLSEIPSVTIMD